MQARRDSRWQMSTWMLFESSDRGPVGGLGDRTVLFVGDDRAENHHDVEVQDVTGRRLGKARFPGMWLGSSGCMR